MDSGSEERILPSIRRSQIVLIYRKGGVANPETFDQIACMARLSQGWRPAVRTLARSGDLARTRDIVPARVLEEPQTSS